MKKYNIAIVGIRGAVGQEMLMILKERNFPYDQLKLISTSADKDTTDEDGNFIEKIHEDSFKGVRIGLFSPGASVSKIWAPIAAKDDLAMFENLTIDFSILDDTRFRSLRVFGESPVRPGVTGKRDIFAPF